MQGCLWPSEGIPSFNYKSSFRPWISHKHKEDTECGFLQDKGVTLPPLQTAYLMHKWNLCHRGRNFQISFSLTGEVALEQINAYCQMLDMQIRERDYGGILSTETQSLAMVSMESVPVVPFLT